MPDYAICHEYKDGLVGVTFLPERRRKATLLKNIEWEKEVDGEVVDRWIYKEGDIDYASRVNDMLLDMSKSATNLVGPIANIESDLSWYSREIVELPKEKSSEWFNERWYYPQIISAEELNSIFSEYRDAVVMNHVTGKPEQDIDGVKVLRLREIRKEREKHWKELDADFYKALELGDTVRQKSIGQLKQKWRDLPQVVETDFVNLTSVDEVKSYIIDWPS